MQQARTGKSFSTLKGILLIVFTLLVSIGFRFLTDGMVPLGGALIVFALVLFLLGHKTGIMEKDWGF